MDSPPWRDDIISEVPQIENGYMTLPTRPGIGAELNEKEIAKHPWPNPSRKQPAELFSSD